MENKKPISKAKLRALEKVFEREIDRSVLQSSAKIYDELAAEGFVQKRTLTLAVDRFGTMTVTGWALTLAGNYAYCSECDSIMSDEDRKEIEEDLA